jgi:hypothetical protein
MHIFPPTILPSPAFFLSLEGANPFAQNVIDGKKLTQTRDLSGASFYESIAVYCYLKISGATAVD